MEILNNALGGTLKEKFKEKFFSPEASVKGFSDIIQPVVEIDQPIINVVKYGTASATIYTTPTDEDFYLIGYQIISMSVAQNAAGTDYINVVMPTGETQRIACNVLYTSATSEATQVNTMCFPAPILLRKGSNIASVKASSFATFMIYGYTKPSIKRG
jgi:hypothetical protein